MPYFATIIANIFRVGSSTLFSCRLYVKDWKTRKWEETWVERKWGRKQRRSRQHSKGRREGQALAEKTRKKDTTLKLNSQLYTYIHMYVNIYIISGTYIHIYVNIYTSSGTYLPREAIERHLLPYTEFWNGAYGETTYVETRNMWHTANHVSYVLHRKYEKHKTQIQQPHEMTPLPFTKSCAYSRAWRASCTGICDVPH